VEISSRLISGQEIVNLRNKENHAPAFSEVQMDIYRKGGLF
jgi:hypothetical protein